VSKIVALLLAMLIALFYYDKYRKGNSTYFRKIKRGRRRQR